MKIRHIVWILLLIAITAFAEDELQRAIHALGRQDYATAAELLRPLAEAGNPEAQMRLGKLYFHGLGVAEDDGVALRWFERAAEKGLAEAQYLAASMYAFGFGVPRSDPDADRKGAKWYFEAARQGHAEAQYSLAILFITGKGVRKDSTEALKWMRRAAEQGHADAKIYLQGYTPPK